MFKANEGPAAAAAQAIPRKIHYVWFGGKPKPAGMQALINGWGRVMPDHEVIEWNEGNIDVNGHPWMAKMYAEKRYAFASDYARVSILLKHGGIYLDTDMELKKDLTPLLGEQCLCSFEMDTFLATCIMACVPGHPLMAALLKEYDRLDLPLVNNALFTEFFLRNYPEFHVNNKDQRVGEDIRVLPKEYCVIPSYSRDKNYAVHHADNQWKPGERRFRAGRMLRTIIGPVLFYKLVNARMSRSSAYVAMDKAREQ